MPTGVDALEVALEDCRRGIRTALPGIVVSYSTATETAAIQPARMGITNAGEPFLLPILPAVPVLWDRFAGIVIRGRLNPGDLVTLFVSDRELGPWLLTGNTHAPTEERTHALTDAMCLPRAATPKNRPIPPVAGSGGAEFYLGREDGSASLSIPHDVPAMLELEGGPAGIRLGSTAAQPAVLGTTLVAAFTAYCSAISSAATALAAPPNPDPSGAKYEAFCTVIVNATAALALTLANWLATKVVLE